jgi:hypothetical protein
MAKAGLPTTKNDSVRAGSTDKSAGFLIDKLESSDGSVTITESSCGCTVDLTAGGAFAEEWIKVTVDYTDFSAASNFVKISPPELTGLSAGTVVQFAKLKHSVSFVGGSTSSASLSVGIGTSTTAGTDVFTAPGNKIGRQQSISFSQLMDQTATDDIVIGLLIAGDTCDNLTAGVAEVWIKTATLL